jgi:3-oxoadipate enol-lactonase
MASTDRAHRAANGIFYRVEGDGEPLLMLHCIFVSGEMFDPLIALLRDRYRMLIPDLRGHGRSGDLPGPYDVQALAADLDAVLREAGVERCAVMGYSHGGAVAQQFAHARAASVARLMLACTYACNASTVKERIECEVFAGLLYVLSPATIAKLIFRPSKPKPTGPIGLTPSQAMWMRQVMAANNLRAMHGALRGLITFDSRPWLNEIDVPTLVVAGADDRAVPRHHYETLLSGIPAAKGRLVERADHTLVWTHTRELADVMRGWS